MSGAPPVTHKEMQMFNSASLGTLVLTVAIAAVALPTALSVRAARDETPA